MKFEQYANCGGGNNSAPVPLRPTRTTHEAIWD